MSETRKDELLHVLMFQRPPRRLIPLHPFLECNRDGARKGSTCFCYCFDSELK